jgi:hypothetical protein
VFKSLAIAVLLVGLAACSAHPPQPTRPQLPNQPSAGPASLPAAGNYSIDSNKSELRILVYKAGPLASLGHNHVMVNRAMSGSVQVAGSLTASSFALSIPVAQFSVDDATARQEEGSEFPGDIPEDAKSGTLHNMQSDALLNAAMFPSIMVQCLGLSDSQGMLTASLKISVAGRDSTVAAPFSLQGDAHDLTATVSFELRQTALGLTPYSLLGGALRVQDAMRIKLKVVAHIS